MTHPTKEEVERLCSLLGIIMDPVYVDINGVEAEVVIRGICDAYLALMEKANCAVQRFVRGEDKACLVCGKREPCTEAPDACTFDKTPMELMQQVKQLQAYNLALQQERDDIREVAMRIQEAAKAQLDQHKADNEALRARMNILEA